MSFEETEQFHITRRVFLVGSPRSGTTLAQSMLAVHPAVYSLPETHFFASLTSRHRLMQRLGLPSTKGWYTYVQPLIDHGEFSAAVVKEIMGKFTVRGRAKRFIEVLDEKALAAGKTVWLEKTPRHLWHLDVITRNVPYVRYIHVLREGRDTIASLYEVRKSHEAAWRGAWSVDACVDRWIKDIRLSHEYRGRPGHLHVTYAELTQSPTESVKRCCTFLDLDYSDDLLQARAAQSDQLITEGEAWKSNVNAPIEQRSGTKFREVFSEDEQAHVLKRLRETLENEPKIFDGLISESDCD